MSDIKEKKLGESETVVIKKDDIEEQIRKSSE